MVKRCIHLVLMVALLSFLPARGDVNLALGKKYTFSPKPNYKLCTDDGDSVQLTDGISQDSDWRKKSTVGWQRPPGPIEITIDLEQIYRIEKIHVHSIGGGTSGVDFPEMIGFLISSDGLTYDAAAVVAEPAGYAGKTNSKVPYIFTVSDIGKNARFVKVLVRSSPKFMFMDEIEIIGSASISLPEKPATMLFQADEVMNFFLEYDKQLSLENIIQANQRTIKKLANTITEKNRLDALGENEKLLNHVSVSNDKFLSKELLCARDKKAWQIRAQLYRQYYKKSFAVFPADPMQGLKAEDFLLSGHSDKAGINLAMLKGEFEAAAINIINCSDDVAKLSVSVSPLIGPDCNYLNSEDIVTVRRGIYVHARQAGCIVDPLVLQGTKPFELQPGHVSQIWLSVQSKDLLPGDYKVSVAVLSDAEDGQSLVVHTVELKIKVLNLQFPKQVSLNTCVWAYPETVKLSDFELNQVMMDLRDHYINVCVVHPANIPWPTEDKVNFKGFDTVLKRHNYARTYLLFLNFQQQWTRDKFGAWLSEEWKREFSVWLNKLIGHMLENGYDYDQFAMYLFDEELGDDNYTLAKLIKDTNPKIRIYANRFGEGDANFRRFKSVVDIWSPSVTQCGIFPELLKEIKKTDAQVWTYDTKGPGKVNDPYGYYRLLPWRAYENGQTGTGFWVYMDERNWSLWDDSLKVNGNYGVVYNGSCSTEKLDKEVVVTSKRWEAWREGVEDYEYLQLARKVIDDVAKTDKNRADVLTEKLNRIVRSVIRAENDSSVINESRLELMEIITGTVVVF